VQTVNAVDLIRRMHQHRAWVNGLLLNAAGQLKAEQLRQSFPIGQGSIWKSLTHLHCAEYVWLDALHGKEQSIAPGDVAGKLPGNQEGPDAYRSLDDLKSAWSELDARWLAYFDKLTPECLDDVVYKVRSLGGPSAFRRSDILIHVCTHAQYTVAQVVNMLRHAGAAALPDPMLITLARSEAQAG
jgi:uncharacterized damage-inducible protein DinB